MCGCACVSVRVCMCTCVCVHVCACVCVCAWLFTRVHAWLAMHAGSLVHDSVCHTSGCIEKEACYHDTSHIYFVNFASSAFKG
jgi:hypothetical protein